ncbi:hypothetical protein CHS0354_029451 [Potamilus streckersoni]|uniref:Netrin receptor UNC5 n=1 Tax=Potamilus streckersoni TaxID=2493646 RepID=A0AAE0W2H0_9BIVA|nr:hypothetical protein CHS0354_029451 [Potamilus streckersoni]
MDSREAWLIGLTVSLVFISIILAISCVCIYLLYRKLRQHEGDILSLQQLEENRQTQTNLNGQLSFSNFNSEFSDSAFEVNEINVIDNVEMRRSNESNQVDMRVKPRCTIKIKREHANIFGHKPLASQMVALAQDYYKDENKSTKIVPADQIYINSSDDTGRKTVFSNVLDDDTFSGRPTSFMIDTPESSKTMTYTHYKEGVFAHKKIGKSGGEIVISGVHLKVPRDALDDSVVISVGIIWDEKFQPKLSKQQALLSPIVLCQPNGIRFKRPPKLTFPHCALNLENWNTCVFKREGALEDANEWSIISDDDAEEKTMMSAQVCLKPCHFTLYTLVGESKEGQIAAKAVKMVAFSPGLSNKEIFTTRIYCVNDYKEYQEVKTIEKDDLKSILSGSLVPLFIHDNGNNVLVELSRLSEDWKNMGDNVEELSFEAVWHAQSPSCTFNFRPIKSLSPRSITCDFAASQVDGKDKAVLKIAESMAKTISPLSDLNEDPEAKVHQQLILLLDPKRPACSDAGDWQDLADKMGYSEQYIIWLGSQPNPTELLIGKWRGDGKPYKDLMHLLEEINRLDAVFEIEKLLPFLRESS